jgi:Domain of unknown function (DUF4412)
MRPALASALPVVTALLVGALAPASPAAAGIHYESVTNTQPAQGKATTMRVEGWVAGERAKIEFVASDNAVMPPGTYLVTQDGGKTLYLVNPEEKTYAEWNLDQMLQTMASVMQAMGPLLKFEISNVHVEKLGDEPGPELLGVATRHYRYHTTYDMKVKVMGMGRSSVVDRMQELWTTQALGDPGLGVWLRKEPPTTGDPDLDNLIATEMTKIQGFPLKTVEVSTTTDGKKGRKSETRVETEVTTLDRNAGAPASGFEVPAGYRKTEMVPTAGPQGQDEEGDRSRNPFKKIFGGGSGG